MPTIPLAERPVFAGHMSKSQRLAAFLVMIGPDAAAPILQGLDDTQLQQVTSEMPRLPFVDLKLQTEILQEFRGLARRAGVLPRVGLDYVQSTLEKALGPARAAEVLARLFPNRAPVPAMQELVEADGRLLANALQREQPQTIALMVSFLPADKAATVLGLLAEERRAAVIERLATLQPMPLEVVEKVARALRRQIGENGRPTLQESDGLRQAARLLNAMSRDSTRSVLTALEKNNPDLRQAIQQRMFTFENLAALDSASLQKIMREVDARTLALALKNAPDSLRTALFRGLSQRAAETVNEEISFLGRIKAREVAAAQQAVIDSARRLEEAGEIDLTENAETP